MIVFLFWNLLATALVLSLVLERPRSVDGWILEQSPTSRYDAGIKPGGCSVSGRVDQRCLAATSLLATTTGTTENDTTVIEVCLSPGCVADGADGVLLKLRALSASCGGNVDVAPGVCCSLCGNGPIAQEPATGKKHRKLTSNQKILGLLSLDSSDLDPNQAAVLEGIDAFLRGEEDLKRKNYKGALQQYAKGLETGMTAAIALGASSSNKYTNDTDNDEDNDEDNIAMGTTTSGSASLQWVIQALCGEATAKLNTKDTDGAVLSSGTAYQLSNKTSARALEVLQEAYQTRGDDRLELEALEALFVRYEAQEKEEASIPRARRKRRTPMEANKRRTLGFRLSSLQSSLGK